MTKGKLTISIDLELAWGVWDTVTAEDLRLAESAERPICKALLELFDRHGVAATWVTVAALLDEESASGRPGSRSCWYAPDIIEGIAGARVGHEIGSHGGRHIYFNRISATQASDDLEYAKYVHQRHRLGFLSFVFPRGAVGHPDVLARAGLRVVRSRDVGLLRTVHHDGRITARVANFADHLFPVPPRPAFVEKFGALADIPGSMQMIGRNGLRRLVLPAVTRAKLAMGLERARRSGGTFHLWFHPSNFYYRRDEQLGVLDWFLERAAAEAGRGRIEIRTMGSYAPSAAVGTMSAA